MYNNSSVADIKASQICFSKTSLRIDVQIEGLEELEENLSANNSYGRRCSLKYFQSSLFATILEDAIAQLRILEESNNSLRVTKAMSDMGLLLAKKYAVPQRTVGGALDDIDPKRLNCMEYKLQKLDDDRKYVKEVLIGTYVDISLTRSFEALAEYVQAVVDRDRNRAFLAEEESNNRLVRRELNRQLRHQRNHIKTVFYDTDAVIENLKTEVEDASLNSKIRNRYTENWQLARTEQHLQTILDKESAPLHSILYYKERADQEHTVHSEVELLINIAINETLQKVEQWMNKYDRDVEAIDLKIQKRKNQYDDMVIKNDNLEKMLAEHEVLVKNWVDYKDERERLRLEREKMNNAALTIQAWWRGLLVRNELGPYKVVKRRPPPPPPGGKKGKK